MDVATLYPLLIETTFQMSIVYTSTKDPYRSKVKVRQRSNKHCML